MLRKVVLSKIAERKLEKLLYYLESNWSEKIKLNFVRKLEKRLLLVQQRPQAFVSSKIKNGLHKCVITRQTSMFYTFDENTIYILTFFDSRQDPESLQFELE